MRSMVAAGLLLLAAACQTPAQRRAPAVALAIENVTVVNPASRKILTRRSVYVDAGRIVAVLPARQRRSLVAARTVDGRGKFLIPGLMDMHVHLSLAGPPQPTLNLLLANGVTGVREMSGDCWEPAAAGGGCIADFRALQAKIEAGEVAGPEIVAIGSAMVMGPGFAPPPKAGGLAVAPRTPEEARLLARYLKARGVDLIKTHHGIPAAVFAALGAEARTLGLEVSGHVPFGVKVTDLAAHGFRSIEHARDLLYDCSRYGADYRRTTSALAEGKPGARGPPDEVRITRTVDEFDAELCRNVLSTLAHQDLYYVPTHVTREMDARAADSAYRADPRRKYVPTRRNAEWDADLARTAASGAEGASLYELFFRHGLEITRRAHEAGVRIMVGTDANDTMIFPGFSLHDELRMLAAAGLTPMDILRAATTVPAAYLRRTDLGRISAGAEADLVLLTENPADDILNSSSIAAVVTNGRLYDRAALNALLAEAERLAVSGG